MRVLFYSLVMRILIENVTMRVCKIYVGYASIEFIVLSCEYCLFFYMRVLDIWCHASFDYASIDAMRVLNVFLSCEYCYQFFMRVLLIVCHASIGCNFFHASIECNLSMRVLIYCMPCEFVHFFFPCEYVPSLGHASLINLFSMRVSELFFLGHASMV